MTAIPTRQLGDSDLQLTLIGLGTWAWGGGKWKFGWGHQEEKDSLAALEEALEAGINWIDTAPVYGLGQAEEVLGKAISGMKDRPIIASKCGLPWNERRQVSPSLTKESVLREVEGSLQRLQIDLIDLYQIHWPFPETEIEEAWETVSYLKEKGVIRYGGVSNFNADQLKRVGTIGPVTSLQPPYSMLERTIEKEVLPQCEKDGIGVIVYSPLQKGILTDKFTREWAEALPSSDHRKRDPLFADPALEENLEIVEKLKSIANSLECTVAQLAVAWTLHHPSVTAAIVGARKKGQIQETVEAARIELSPETMEEIDRILKRGDPV